MVAILSYTATAANLEVLQDARSRKALDILKSAPKWRVEHIQVNGKTKLVYRVPSSIAALYYHTNHNACSCPDFTRRFRAQRAAYGSVNKNLACKHMLAVRMFLMLEAAKTANVMLPEELPA
jgi:hypothetical protein